ncbi:MAG: disulfide bond formation protein B [Nevskiaceae bacterium]|nr:MAG: disulfide bond formation protein B [Nevskiaceae bacterium]
MKAYYRLFSLAGFLACAGCMAFALYLEYVKHLEPCPMCIFQRVAMIVTGVFFLLGALHGPKAWGRWVYSGLATLSAVIGALIAARHVWLQSLPEDQVPACGPTLNYLMDMMPLREVVEYVLKGEGSCAKIVGEWLGLTLPMWTMIGFIALAGYAVSGPILARAFEKNS